MRIFLWILILFTATVGLAVDDAPSAVVVEGNGTVYLNGQQVAFGRDMRSIAAMRGDVIETKSDGRARVNGSGLAATTGGDTIVRLQTDGLSLDRGDLLVGTGKSVSILARDLKVTPVSNSWTQFSVRRSTGTIQILALKNDVTVSCGTGRPITVKEGQQLSREDAADCGVAEKSGGAPAAAHGPVLASETAKRAALAVGVSVAAWAIFQPDDPVSPSAP